MPLFYFSTRDTDDPSGPGIEFSTAAEACREAQRALRTMLAEAPLEVSEMAITVLDENGRVLQRARLKADIEPGTA